MALAQAIRTMAWPLEDARGDFDPIVERCRRAHVVLVGEATHGTHEFYEARARLTRRLIDELGFDGVAIEGDWPDAARVHRWVTDMQSSAQDADAVEALEGFRRFPTWMWRNLVVADFVGWMQSRNLEVAHARKAGFFGLDLYSLHASIAEVIRILDRLDPGAAKRARERYECFESFADGAERYGMLASLGISETCERAVLAQVIETERLSFARTFDVHARDAFFDAERNARLVANAEHYYRTMYFGDELSWNLRDRHMADTLDAVIDHLRRGGREGKIVVWAHNSHLGDARATEMSRRGELNLGQLARERYGESSVNVGFTTFAGTVTAATDWDGIAERKRVRPGLEGSVESLFHDVGIARFGLDLRDLGEASGALSEEMLERAIGVVYRPETERMSHYFHTRLAQQFDFVLHYDVTRALEPIERASIWTAGEPPETYPSAM